MRTIRIVLISFIFIQSFQTVSQTHVNAQESWFNKMGIEEESAPFNNLFIYKTLTMPATESNLTQLTCYIKIANDLLQFIRKETVFIAQYELIVFIQNLKEETVASKITKKEIRTANFTDTNSHDLFSHVQIDFSLTPGKYTLYIEIMDFETRNTFRHHETIILPDFHAKTLSVTDILFSKSTDSDVLFPVFPAIYSQQDSDLRATFYVQSNIDSLQRISIKKTILNKNDQPVTVDSFHLQLDSTITPVSIELDNPIDFGQYTLSLEISNDIIELIINEPFYIRWKNHSTWIPDFNELIEIMRYIMDSAQWEQLIHLPNDEQEKMIETFWQERDPFPSTEENELEDEYFRRIAISNRYFSTWREETKGWQTDRGRIYIIYGKPSLVENPSVSTSDFSRYEIWIYNHLQKRFVFLDRLGSGNYQLIAGEQL